MLKERTDIFFNADVWFVKVKSGLRQCNQAFLNVLLHYIWSFWSPTKLFNSPVFFFRSPLVQQVNWILYLTTVGLRECKAAVLYHIKLMITHLEYIFPPATICAYTVSILYLPKSRMLPGGNKKRSHGFFFFLPTAQWQCIIPSLCFWKSCFRRGFFFWKKKNKNGSHC